MIDLTAVDSTPEARFVEAFEVRRAHMLNGRGHPLSDVRDQAIREFAQLGFPSTKHEAWKYTPITRQIGDRYQIAVSPEVPVVEPDEIRPHLIDGLDADVAVLVNGVFVANLSTTRGALKVKTLAESADDSVFRRHFASRTREAREPFASLNTAFAKDGLFIHAPSGSRAIVHILNVTTVDSTFLQPRHLFVIDDGAELEIIETHVGRKGVHNFSNAVAEAFVGKRGRLDYYRLQDDPGMSGVTSTFAYQQESSCASITTVTLSGGMIRNNVNVLPDASFCESHLVGLFIGKGDMHIDSHTLVDHARPDCFSNEMYKGILADRARGVFNGKVLVRRDAQRTNAYQSNKSIVLDDSASMNAKPELEIYADDVKCSHGATTGRLDAEALFYIRSRGLSEQRARTMLLLAFARDVLDNVRVDALRDMLDRAVTAKLA